MVGASFGSKGAYLPILSTILVMLCSTIPVDVVGAQETVVTIEIGNGETIVANHNVSQGDYFSVEVECESCETVLYLNELEIDRDFTTSHGMIDTSGTLNLTITSNIQDSVNYAIVVDINDMNVKSRPSPQQEVNSLNPHTCEIISQCIDFSQEKLSTNSPKNLSNAEHYSKGVLDSQSSEYFSIPVMEGESLELNLLHSTADFEVEIYFQNDTSEELLGKIIDYNTPKSLFLSLSSEFLYFDESGRIIVKLNSETSETLWIMQHIIHSKIDNEVINVSQNHDFFGHGEMNLVIEVIENTALVIQSPMDNLNVTYWSLFEGQWILLKQQQSVLESHYIYSLPESTAIKLEFIGDIYSVALSTDDYWEKIEQKSSQEIGSLGCRVKPKLGNQGIVESWVESVLSSPIGSGNGQFDNFTGTNQTTTPAFCLHSVSALKKVGGWDESFITSQDSDLSMRLLEHGFTIWRTDSTHVNMVKKSN